MKGLTFEDIEQVVYQTDLPEPAIEHPGDVIVSVQRAGICGSDLHQYHGRERVRAGTIPGHEFVGEIVALGNGVTQLQPGDRVFSPFTTCCGHCFFCRHGLSIAAIPGSSLDINRRRASTTAGVDFRVRRPN